ncbi:MAG TPA: hypothetical protein VMW54_00910 [Terriglobia bacterium]|nr:hypothetical protein [Terriglobia bacterium]
MTFREIARRLLTHRHTPVYSSACMAGNSWGRSRANSLLRFDARVYLFRQFKAFECNAYRAHVRTIPMFNHRMAHNFTNTISLLH